MDPEFTHLSVMDIPPEAAMDADLKAKVYVLGTTRLPRVLPFAARLDANEIIAVAVDTTGTGFTGYLPERPPEGARLIVEFRGQEPIDTGLVYHEEDAPIA